MTTLNKQKDSAEQNAGNLGRFITVQRLRGIVRSDQQPRALGLLVGHLQTEQATDRQLTHGAEQMATTEVGRAPFAGEHDQQHPQHVHRRI